MVSNYSSHNYYYTVPYYIFKVKNHFNSTVVRPLLFTMTG